MLSKHFRNHNLTPARSAHSNTNAFRWWRMSCHGAGQAGFRARERIEAFEVDQPLWIISLDLSKTFDRVNSELVWQAVGDHGVAPQLSLDPPGQVNWRALSGRRRKMHVLHKFKSGRSVYSKIRSKICNVDPKRWDSYRAVGFKFRFPLKMWGARSISSSRAPS